MGIKMGDIKLDISIKEENNILFKRCIRKLLDSTFIVKSKDMKLYKFISRETNRQDISDYLRMIGFDVLVDTNAGIAMLKPYEADEEAVGLKRANIVTFTTEQYHLLLVLWEVYLENLGYNDENIVLRGDLIDKIKAYEVDIDSNKLSAAMKIFKNMTWLIMILMISQKMQLLHYIHHYSLVGILNSSRQFLESILRTAIQKRIYKT